MRIFIDNSVIGHEHYFSKKGLDKSIDIIILPAGDLQSIINGQNLEFKLTKTDIFIIRSKVKFKKDSALNLPGFIGSSISGDDHLDIDWLKSKGVEVFCAKGCNALSVRDYVLAVLINLKILSFDINTFRVKVAGVIGFGHVGRKVADLLYSLGFKVIVYDPFFDDFSCDSAYSMAEKLDELFDCDLISINCSLTKKSEYKDKASENMINKSFIQNLKPGVLLLNSSRGEVINEAGLLKYSKHIHYCLDVWANEPEISNKLVLNSKLATPHIAGHSKFAKLNGLDLVYNALISWAAKSDGFNKSLFVKLDLPKLSNLENIYDGVLGKCLKLNQISDLLKDAASLDFKDEKNINKYLKTKFLNIRSNNNDLL